MKSFLVILVTVSLLVPIAAYSEPHLGGKAGVMMAMLNRDTALPLASEPTYKFGLIAGADLKLRYWDQLMPQLELSFSQRGTAYKINGEDGGSLRLNYVDLLLLTRFELPVKNSRIYGLAGSGLSVILTATNISALDFKTDIRDQVNTFDIELLLGAGISVGPYSWGTLIMEVRYDRGLRNVDKNGDEDGITVSNQTIAFLVGYEYRRDRDGDGIADSQDRCPREAEDRDGFEDSDGCPDPDHDSPGVARYP